MKKMYLKPETKSYKIELHPLMNMSFDDPNNSGNGSLINDEAEGPALSRESEWDE